jgi:hypothetical protein
MRNVTIKQLARAFGRDPSVIGKWLRGRGYPTVPVKNEDTRWQKANGYTPEVAKRIILDRRAQGDPVDETVLGLVPPGEHADGEADTTIPGRIVDLDRVVIEHDVFAVPEEGATVYLQTRLGGYSNATAWTPVEAIEYAVKIINVAKRCLAGRSVAVADAETK